MNNLINSLALLHIKIAEGSASDEEKAIYNGKIAMSCIRKNVLIKAIEQKAKEIKKQKNI